MKDVHPVEPLFFCFCFFLSFLFSLRFLSFISWSRFGIMGGVLFSTEILFIYIPILTLFLYQISIEIPASLLFSRSCEMGSCYFYQPYSRNGA